MSQCPTAVHIPTPCQASWAAMAPTSAGRHCAACQTEVVDFTQMSEAEVVAYLTTRKGQKLCGRMTIPTVEPRSVGRASSPVRWLLAIAAVVGWQPSVALSLPPQMPPSKGSFLKATASQAAINVQGVVLDDLYKVPVVGAYVFIKNTKYGAVTDANGGFMLVLPADWAPLKGGVLTLLVLSNPFNFLNQVVKVNLRRGGRQAPLTIRLLSQPERGVVMGKPALPSPPAALPTPRKSR